MPANIKNIKNEDLIDHRFISNTLSIIRGNIRSHMLNSPSLAFRPGKWLRVGPEEYKPFTNLDLMAEIDFIHQVNRKFGEENVLVLGEEHLERNIDLTSETKPCYLIDIIDGTDLLKRGLGNWCSAIVVFRPDENRILGSFVAVQSIFPNKTGFLYYKKYSDESSSIKKCKLSNNPDEGIEISSLPRSIELKHASLCLNTQKSGSLLKFLESKGIEKFIKWLKAIREEDQILRKAANGEILFRMYNLAGMPMIVKILDGDVDLCANLKGSAPHDIVAGAYLALKAGATMITLENKKIDLNILAAYLKKPSDPIPANVIASSDRLCGEFLEFGWYVNA